MAETIELREGTYVFQLLEKITPRVPNEPPYRRKYVLKDRSLVKDAKTGQNRFLRYIPGATSMFLDEQEKLDKNYAAMNAWKPEFNYGTLILSHPQDDEKIRVMMLRDEFDGKDNRISKEEPLYTLVNKEQEYNNEAEFLVERHKAEGMALAAEYDDMRSHAIYLGVATKDGQRERTEAEIRHDYFKKASANPAVFLKTIESPTVKLESYIKEAVKIGSIDLGHVKNQAHYMDTKALITTLDPKEDTVKQLLEYALSKKGDLFRKNLPNLVKK